MIKETFDLKLSLLQSGESIPDKVNNEHVIHVSSIHTIDNIQKYKLAATVVSVWFKSKKKW